MTLRQKIFAAIIAVMAIEFLLVAMVSLLEGLDARKAQVRLDGLDGEAARLFREAVASSGDAVWRRLPRELDALDPRIRWEIRGAQRGPAAGAEPQGSPRIGAQSTDVRPGVQGNNASKCV